MIYIRKVAEAADAALTGRPDAERTLSRLISANSRFAYPEERDLHFELRMREATLEAARALNGSGAAFATFEESRCNPDYWERRPNGAFRLRPDRSPSAAIRDIFRHGPLYGFECATAIVIVFYKAALDTIGDEAYDRLFSSTYLFHWNVDRDLGLTTTRGRWFVPGDCLYFDNPDVDPATPQWQGENVIDMGDGLYYGHGIGIRRAADIVAKLNAHRRPGALRSAVLLEQTTRPDYVLLSRSAAALPPGVRYAGAAGLPGSAPHRARIGSSVWLLP